MTLMLLGSAGVVAVVASLLLSFIGASGGEGARRLGVLLGGLVALWLLARSAAVDRALTAAIVRVVGRFSDLDVRDYARLLHLAEQYAVLELRVQDGDWLAGRTLEQLQLRDEGIAILGVQRADGVYLGSPVGGTPVAAGDTLLVYGRTDDLRELDRRPAGPEGDRAHERAVQAHRHEVAREVATDPATPATGPRTPDRRAP
ncbi:MAG TPA: TrkA C-terminal domain-containing protein [Miltoncostaeaceae bacterium]|nr:TrkA C-terminal domain-containing protein [Miltoncostaeaceae bacterium]